MHVTDESTFACFRFPSCFPVIFLWNTATIMLCNLTLSEEQSCLHLMGAILGILIMNLSWMSHPKFIILLPVSPPKHYVHHSFFIHLKNIVILPERTSRTFFSWNYFCWLLITLDQAWAKYNIQQNYTYIKLESVPCWGSQFRTSLLYYFGVKGVALWPFGPKQNHQKCHFNPVEKVPSQGFRAW